MLTENAKAMIADWPLGFVATADAGGTPNLSPKGTFRVLDDRTIGFADIRSPNTMRNIQARRQVAVNFFDILTRKATTISGTARTVARDSGNYASLVGRFVSAWGDDFEAMFNSLVVIDVDACQDIDSPAYDAGATEEGLREDWMGKITDAYNRQRAAADKAG